MTGKKTRTEKILANVFVEGSSSGREGFVITSKTAIEMVTKYFTSFSTVLYKFVPSSGIHLVGLCDSSSRCRVTAIGTGVFFWW
ncbi:hypothetical protein V6N11_055729 [Hibiscus sabdariffa]|uniref:Uncharacterized protein n=1 Tax=Hibiscus sabdariffa TaxID=183260 RepID=A0ABR2NHH6_9ROSI